jgi:hypothetical protein
MLWIVTLTDPIQPEAPAPGTPPRHYTDICYFQAEAETADEAIRIAMDSFEGAYTQASAALDDLNNSSTV